jgi:hypothetical protein
LEWRYGTKKYGVEITFYGIIFLPKFMKIYQFVQNLLLKKTDSLTRARGHLKSKTFRF